MVLLKLLAPGLVVAACGSGTTDGGPGDTKNIGAFVDSADAGPLACGNVTCADGNVCVDQVVSGGAVGTPPRHGYRCATLPSTCQGAPDCACMEAHCETLSCIAANAPGKSCCLGTTGKTVQCAILGG